MMNNNLMIYVHIPFCDSKCYYCDFNSGVYNTEIKEKYFNSLIEEIESKKSLFKDRQVTSVYIGGGTPSSVDAKYITRVLDTIKQNYNLSLNAEINIEANPCSTDKSKLEIYFKAGVNRISFGVQSLNNKQLKTIGRRHNKSKAIKVIKLAKEVGFVNVNADLLIGLPKQSYLSLKNSALKLIKNGINHISCYMLINEPNTKLTKLIENGLKVPDEDKCVLYYNKLVKFLDKHNFYRYEISNFAKKDCECKHNKGYWDMTEYVGFGLSAHSFYNNSRIENSANITDYINGKIQNKIEELNNKEIIEEYIMLGLRQTKGINLTQLNNLGYNLLNEKKSQVKLLIDNDIIAVNNVYLSIKKSFFGVCNDIIVKLLP